MESRDKQILDLAMEAGKTLLVTVRILNSYDYYIITGRWKKATVEKKKPDTRVPGLFNLRGEIVSGLSTIQVLV